MMSLDDQTKEVKDHIRGQIFRNELPEGSKLVEAEIKRGTGATFRAVRKALVELTREGLLDRRRRMGTFVAVASSANTRFAPAVGNIAILSSHRAENFDSGRYVAPILEGLREGLQPPKQVTLFANTDKGSHTIDSLPLVAPETVRAAAQGLISIEANNAVALNDFVRAGIPVVAIDYCPPRSLFDAVLVDHVEAGYQATAHLLSMGHRRVGFIGERANYRSSDPTWQDRFTGYLRAMAEFTGVTGGHWLLNVRRDGAKVTKLLPAFQSEHKLTAYVMCTGGFLLPALAALEGLNLSCPNDISLVSADASKRSFKDGVLSCIKVDYEDLGRCAIRVLAARLACRSMPAIRVVVPVEIVLGNSSGPCGTAGN